MDTSTIAAIATPQGSGGIGIIRISGPQAAEIAASIFYRKIPDFMQMFRSAGKPAAPSAALSPTEFVSHQLYHGYIADTETRHVLDEVLITLMQAPRSYTAEDVVEIQAHCNPLVLRSILELVIRRGARLAEPGEFTRRAFTNGRIDLTQAEAVADIINARSAGALDMAVSQIRGRLKQEIEAVRQVMIDMLTEIEAIIDFPEEVENISDPDLALQKIQTYVIKPLEELIQRYENAHFLRDGFKLVIVGPPNVGKSSLMNLLIDTDRSIVTDIPGTTRDVIEDSFTLDGMPMVLTDTAGFHETDDPVETIGIQKARRCIDQADLILLMMDARMELKEENFIPFANLKDKRLIVVLNKMDLPNQNPDGQLPDSWRKHPLVRISARHQQGINALKRSISNMIMGKVPDRQHTVVPNLRHKTALEKSLASATATVDGLRNRSPYELIAIDLNESVDTLGEILGSTVKVDILEKIFSNFCIGK